MKNAYEIFENFRRRKIYTLDDKSYKIRDDIKDKNGNKITYEGVVKTSLGNKGFINPDLFENDIYFIPSYVHGRKVKQGDRLEFNIGFNLFGPIATNIKIKN